MARRLICAAVLTASTGLYTLAASERATLVLTDGERKSGSLAFHLDKHETIITNMFQLNVEPDREIQIPIDQIAVVEFLGGRPPVSELQALPSDNNTHMLVMRNGSTQRGRLLNLVNGDTVKWQDESGQQHDYPIREVSRIYLNPSVARSVFNYNPTGANAAGAAGQAMAPGAIQVKADVPWTDTGVAVHKGDRLSFQASGEIAFGRSPGQTSRPEGNAGTTNASFPAPNQPAGMLIGRIVTSGSFRRLINSAPFAIGANTQPITMPADGRLYLGINDNELTDNSGYYTVTITRQ